MNCSDVMLYISAFVDRDYAGMPDALRAEVEYRFRACAHCASELTMEIAMKQFIARYRTDTRCPRATVEQIQTFLYHVYRSGEAQSLSG